MGRDEARREGEAMTEPSEQNMRRALAFLVERTEGDMTCSWGRDAARCKQEADGTHGIAEDRLARVAAILRGER